MQVSSRVYRFSGPLGTVVMGSNVYLLVGDGLTLVDTGFRGRAGRVLGEIRRLGYSPSDIERIIVTHHHADHAGSLAVLKAATGAAVDDATRDAFRAAWRAVFPLARAAPPRLTLRDYHADNLIWLPGRAGLRRVGLLDFQDAVLGAPAYDLVSLLEDARRDVAPETVAAMRARYLAARPETDADAFDAAYAMLGAQRNCKIVGIFTRLWRRDGKPAYLDHLPRVWAHLARDLAHPTLAPLRAWFDEAAPPRLHTRPDQCP